MTGRGGAAAGCSNYTQIVICKFSQKTRRLRFALATFALPCISEENRIFLLEVAEGKMEVVLVHHHLLLSAQFMEEELLGDFVC